MKNETTESWFNEECLCKAAVLQPTKIVYWYIEQIKQGKYAKNFGKRYKQKAIKGFYLEIKSRNAGRKRPLLFVKDKGGNLLGDADDIIERWREYYKELLNVKERKM